MKTIIAGNIDKEKVMRPAEVDAEFKRMQQLLGLKPAVQEQPSRVSAASAAMPRADTASAAPSSVRRPHMPKQPPPMPSRDPPRPMPVGQGQASPPATPLPSWTPTPPQGDAPGTPAVFLPKDIIDW